MLIKKMDEPSTQERERKLEEIIGEDNFVALRNWLFEVVCYKFEYLGQELRGREFCKEQKNIRKTFVEDIYNRLSKLKEGQPFEITLRFSPPYKRNNYQRRF